MSPPSQPDQSFSLFPSARRSHLFAILCFLLAVPGVMAWWLENEPGSGDDLLYVFLSVPWLIGGIYLLRRGRKPILHADREGLTYFPYDDPVARLRDGAEVRVAWTEIESVALSRLGRPAVLPFMILHTFDGRRVELPLAALGLTFDELLERLQAAAGSVHLLVER